MKLWLAALLCLTLAQVPDIPDNIDTGDLPIDPADMELPQQGVCEQEGEDPQMPTCADGAMPECPDGTTPDATSPANGMCATCDLPTDLTPSAITQGMVENCLPMCEDGTHPTTCPDGTTISDNVNYPDMEMPEGEGCQDDSGEMTMPTCADGNDPTCPDGTTPNVGDSGMCSACDMPTGDEDMSSMTQEYFENLRNTCLPKCADGSKPNTCPDGSQLVDIPDMSCVAVCADDSFPTTCADGSTLSITDMNPDMTGCEDGSTPTCSDGSNPVVPDTCDTTSGGDGGEGAGDSTGDGSSGNNSSAGALSLLASAVVALLL